MTTPVWQPGTLYNPGAIVQRSSSAPVVATAPANPGFEEGNTGWTLGTGFTIETGGPGAVFEGSWSVRYNNGGESILYNNNEVPVIVGQSITASCYVQQGASSSGQAGAGVRIQWLDAGSSVVAESLGNYVFSGSNSEWKVSTVTGVAPAGAVAARIAALAYRNSGGASLWIDSFTWNYVYAEPPDGLVFRAVQPDAGYSGASEPAWPNVNGVQVIDNEVIWEAIIASRVVWEAVPILVSGATEPDFPLDIGSAVSDNTIAWVAVSRRVEDERCPNSKVVAIAASKVFAADDDIINYSATVNPLDWSTAENAGYLPFGLQSYGANPVLALGLYRSNLIAFNSAGFQMWQVDEDPANMALLDAVPIGCTAPYTPQPVQNDLVFLSAVGIRNIGIAGASTNLQAGTFGEAIDALVREQVRAGTYTPLATFIPRYGQYWLIFGPQAFVLTITDTRKMSWSRYVFPEAITDLTLLDSDLYLRTENDKVWVLDDDTTEDDYACGDNPLALTDQVISITAEVLVGPPAPVAAYAFNAVLDGAVYRITNPGGESDTTTFIESWLISANFTAADFSVRATFVSGDPLDAGSPLGEWIPADQPMQWEQTVSVAAPETRETVLFMEIRHESTETVLAEATITLQTESVINEVLNWPLVYDYTESGGGPSLVATVDAITPDGVVGDYSVESSAILYDPPLLGGEDFPAWAALDDISVQVTLRAFENAAPIASGSETESGNVCLSLQNFDGNVVGVKASIEYRQAQGVNGYSAFVFRFTEDVGGTQEENVTYLGPVGFRYAGPRVDESTLGEQWSMWGFDFDGTNRYLLNARPSSYDGAFIETDENFAELRRFATGDIASSVRYRSGAWWYLSAASVLGRIDATQSFATNTTVLDFTCGIPLVCCTFATISATEYVVGWGADEYIYLFPFSALTNGGSLTDGDRYRRYPTPAGIYFYDVDVGSDGNLYCLTDESVIRVYDLADLAGRADGTAALGDLLYYHPAPSRAGYSYSIAFNGDWMVSPIDYGEAEGMEGYWSRPRVGAADPGYSLLPSEPANTYTIGYTAGQYTLRINGLDYRTVAGTPDFAPNRLIILSQGITDFTVTDTQAPVLASGLTLKTGTFSGAQIAQYADGANEARALTPIAIHGTTGLFNPSAEVDTAGWTGVTGNTTRSTGVTDLEPYRRRSQVGFFLCTTATGISTELRDSMDIALADIPYVDIDAGLIHWVGSALLSVYRDTGIDSFARLRLSTQSGATVTTDRTAKFLVNNTSGWLTANLPAGVSERWSRSYVALGLIPALTRSMQVRILTKKDPAADTCAADDILAWGFKRDA